jgi:hypothetical protein
MTLILVVTAWLYVALMMALAEATHTRGSVLGAAFTFVLYGVAPVALLIYLMGRKARRQARQAREPRAQGASVQPDAGGQAPADAVPPVREEP